MIHIDFEFNGILEEKVNLVCCTTHDSFTNETRDWWLHNNVLEQGGLAQYLNSKKSRMFFAWAVIAEARSLQALGLNPVDFKWIDGFLEYRCLTNQNDKLMYGNQLVDGKVKTTNKPKPKWERVEGEVQDGFKPTHSLAEATFKLTGNIRDTEEKNRIRDLIISAPELFTQEERIEIMRYCRDDVVFLPEIYTAILREYKSLGVPTDKTLMEEMLIRGEYSALTAKQESRGYPIAYDETMNFSLAVGPILDDIQREINSLFPEIRPFKWDKSTQRFAWQQTETKKWLRDNVDVSKWMKTDAYKKAQKESRKTKQPIQDVWKYCSLSLEAWERVFPYKHEYPTDSFGAQIVRYLKLKQSLNGFVPGGKKNFWDAVGSDKRVRPYMNIYGSGTSRSQPGSTSYLLLKPAWQRALMQAAPGRAIASFDYKSEEFYISALLSKCENMIKAYQSGDVYLYFGKLAGAIPWEGTKEEWKRERNLFKSLTLGISYLMTAKGLAEKLTADTGVVYTEEQAQDLIDTFYEAYEELEEFQKETMEEYEAKGKLKLPCGWYQFSDNDNFRSTCNMPIQGCGASVLRRAVKLLDAAGIDVIATLHDAIYIEYDEGDFAVLDTFRQCMIDAFVYYFDDKENASKIELDGYSWSRNYPAQKLVTNKKGEKEYIYESIITPGGLEIDVGNLYIDERSVSDYDKFSKYFQFREESYL